MRTTIRLDDDLLAQAKAHAARTGTTLTSLVEDALRERLNRGQPGSPRARPLPTFRGRGGLLPGVDLDDTAALLELMEREPRR